jgi:hypothetical protein
MALAIYFDDLIRRGEVQSCSELAAIGLVSRSRVSQIMDLLNLAPTIQKQLLSLTPTAAGREPITERSLRLLLNTADWAAQIKIWEDMKGGSRVRSMAPDVRVV